jgi:glycosyltransferase involved in cell wall biosynthesis
MPPFSIMKQSDNHMNKPLLSICIPTYNRAHYLKDCLDSIVCQFDDQEVYARVEVVISDNASEDNTGNLVKEYQKRFNNIAYYRNETNVLFDPNVFNSVEKASGIYCWYMGDDDAILNGGIKTIVDYLRKNEVSVLTVNTAPFTTFGEMAGNHTPAFLDAFRVFSSFYDFFKKGNVAGILSVFIFKRDLWLLNVDRNNYILGWLYYEVILRMLPKMTLPFVYCDYPIVYTKQNCDWVTGGTELIAFLNCKRLSDGMIGFGYKKEIIGTAFNVSPKRLIVILLRAKGHDLICSVKNLSLIYREFSEDIMWLPLIMIIYFTPNFAVKAVRDFNKKFTKIKI